MKACACGKKLTRFRRASDWVSQPVQRAPCPQATCTSEGLSACRQLSHLDESLSLRAAPHHLFVLDVSSWRSNSRPAQHLTCSGTRTTPTPLLQTFQFSWNQQEQLPRSDFLFLVPGGNALFKCNSECGCESALCKKLGTVRMTIARQRKIPFKLTPSKQAICPPRRATPDLWHFLDTINIDPKASKTTEVRTRHLWASLHADDRQPQPQELEMRSTGIATLLSRTEWTGAWCTLTTCVSS